MKRGLYLFMKMTVLKTARIFDILGRPLFDECELSLQVFLIVSDFAIHVLQVCQLQKCILEHIEQKCHFNLLKPTLRNIREIRHIKPYIF